MIVMIVIIIDMISRIYQDSYHSWEKKKTRLGWFVPSSEHTSAQISKLQAELTSARFLLFSYTGGEAVATHWYYILLNTQITIEPQLFKNSSGLVGGGWVVEIRIKAQLSSTSTSNWNWAWQKCINGPFISQG